MIPPRLQKGDEIRVVALASSLGQEWMQSLRSIADERFASLGYKLTFGSHVLELDEFHSSSIQSRVDDFRDAIKDPNVKMIISVIGGHNSNELLDYLDYDLIKTNPKIICGYSDITAFTNAITAMTGLVTYSGPAYFSFGMKRGFEYSLEYFNKALTSLDSFEVLPPTDWSDDRWGSNQDERTFHPHEGYKVFSEGSAKGTIVGGNLCTFNLLQGTKFIPSLKDSILFIEECAEEGSDLLYFKRNFQSLIHQTDFTKIKALVIGKFESKFGMTDDVLKKILEMYPFLKTIPVVTNVDIGHTFPQITLPIGGTAKLEAKDGVVSLVLSNN